MNRRDERGSTLIVALAMIAVVGLIVTSGIQFSGTSLRSSNNALRPNRSSLYGADGAMQTAIEFVRDNPGSAADLLGVCPSSTLTYPDPNSGSTISLAVCPQSGSFQYDGPYRAVLVTLSTRGDEGLDLSHNGDVNIGGHVWSNSYINLANPTNVIVKGGNVYAWTSCNRPNGITVDPGFVENCNTSATVGGVVPEIGKDPAIANPADWAPAAPASFAPQSVPSCSGGAATLNPGIYEHGRDLSSLTKSCTNVTLSPGVYYLNFPADGTAASQGNDDDVWEISKTVTAVCDGSGQGAEIVFANAATMSLSGNIVIPCGRTSGSGTPIAMTTLQSDVVSPGGASYLLTPTGATSSSGPSFLNPNNVTTYADNVNATAATVPKSKDVILSTTGFNLQSVTDGSTLSLRARHSESKSSTVSVTVTAGDASTCTRTIPTNTAMTDDAVVLDCPAFHEVEPFTVTYDVRTNQNSTDLALDGLQLTGTSAYTIPKLAGCAVHTATSTGNCALIAPPSDGKGRIDINAVVYMPQSTIAGKFSNVGHFQIGVGVIAWALDLDVNPNLAADPTVGTVSHSYTDGDVRLTASINGSTWIDSRVQYPNGGTTTPVITSWDIQR